MVANVDSLISQLRQLSRDDQQKVVRFLLVELDGERDEGWEEAWAEELERRRELEAQGKITSMPWSEACAKLRERYPSIDDAFTAELACRGKAIEDGSAVLIPADQFLDELRRKFP